MTTHEQFTDELARYALGEIEGEERTSLEQHLAGCSACRRELQQLQGDLALLALSAAGPAPPQRSRQRLLQAIAKETPSAPFAPARRPAWQWAPVFAVLLLVVGSFLLWRENQSLEGQVGELEARMRQEQQLTEHARNVLLTLRSEEAQHFTLVAGPPKLEPQGKAIYLQRTAGLVFVASNLAPLPPNKTYELWLLPASGAAPLPAGVFQPDEQGSAIVLLPELPKGLEAKGFAVTIEPEGGSQTPTMPIVLAGTRG